MNDEDSIAAVATPAGEGAVGIIRVSGPEALEISKRVFVPCKRDLELKERRLIYGWIKEPASRRTIDNGFMVYMKGPGTYTGEDVVELQLHGGSLVLKRTLEALLGGGARLAEPGEFTRRAFMNGRLDLAQAEAVIDIIRARTDAALASARGRLEGAFSKRVNGIKYAVAGLLARVEAVLDFPEEEDVEALPTGVLLTELSAAGEEIEGLLKTFEEGRTLREGVRVLILGRPNVGKSSLLNLLLKEERAIVTPVPGTTRDVIEEAVNIRGLPVRLMDTAGLRETADFVESIGVEAARKKIEGADLVLFVADASGEFSEDLEILKAIRDKKVIVAANKTDLIDDGDREAVEGAFEGRRVEFISARRNTGIDRLEEAVYEAAVGRPPARAGSAEPGELVASVRHREALASSLEGLKRAGAAVGEGLSGEFVATEIHWALARLGEITGEVTTEEILERIFGEFCIGK